MSSPELRPREASQASATIDKTEIVYIIGINFLGE
jgi:hypothetical protein